MFPPDRFVSETPNVIDPGEMPPSRPSRVQRTSSSSTTSSRTSSSQPRVSITPEQNGVYKAPLSRGIKLTLEADDEPDYFEDNDPEYGKPSIQEISRPARGSFRKSSDKSPESRRDEARLFAEALLNESERRESKRRLLIESSDRTSPVRAVRSGILLGFGKVKEMSTSSRNLGGDSRMRKAVGMDDDPIYAYREQQKRKRMCHRAFMAVACVALVVIFTVGSIKALTSRTAYTERMEEAINILVENGISSNDDLRRESSPQYQAVFWMAEGDDEPLPIPDSDDDQEIYRFVQRYVLAVMYHALNGNGWINSLGFTSGVHECAWFEEVPDINGEIYAVGVDCNSDLHVRNILIPSNNLQGTIPDEIRHLKKLDFLSLKHNDLSGSIPSALKELTMLDYLDLKYNQIIGTIPHFLGDLQRLQVLGLSKNQLEGTIPGSFGNLRLKTLAIDDNLLSGSMAPIGMMTNLEYLYAEENELTGSLDRGLLADMNNLIEADLSGNLLESSELPTHLFRLPQLRVLDLAENSLAGPIPSNLAENKVLQHLSLRMNGLTSSIPAALSNLRALTHLDLESNALTGEIPSSLSSMTDLTYLFLGKNPFEKGAIPESLKPLTSLRELSMDYIGLEGPIPTWISDFSGLKLLDLRSNSLTGSIDNIDFAKLKDLTFLMLSDNLLDGALPPTLGSQDSLTVVAIHKNGLIGDAGDLCRASGNVQLLTTDCGDITCDCCDECCDGENCYEGVIWDALENSQPSWEEHFRRADYSFNPHILFSSQSKGNGI